MAMGKPVIVAVAVIALGIGLLVFWHRMSTRTGGSEPGPSVGTATRTSGVSGSARSTPLPVGDFDRIRGELEVRAGAGDTEAAYRLGTTLARCRRYQHLSGDAFTDTVGKALVAFGKGFRIYGSTLEDDRVLDTMLHYKEELDRLCDGAEGLASATEAGDAHTWLLQAAEQGHAGAMAEYGRYAFDEYPGTNELLENAAEVANRRERARVFLQQSLDAGEPEALASLAQAHGPAPYLGHDREAALAYWLAYRKTREGRRLPAGVASLAEENFAKDLTAAEAVRARRRAQDILRGFREAGVRAR